jgi:AraC-like DNA-binding protein
MIFEVHLPKKPLGEFVQSVFYFSDFQIDHMIDRFLPDGNVEIIIDLVGETEYVYDNETFEEIQACRYGWASGIRTKPISIPAGDGSSKIVIVFRKGMAHPFFPVPMGEFSDTVVDAEYFWRGSFRTLRERLLEAEPVTEKFRLIDDFLCSRLDSDTEVNPCVEYALREMVSRPGFTSLSALSTKIGYSQKHFIDLFRKSVGLTPKSYVKVIRFQKAIEKIEAAERLDWTAIALDSGYYDQAHFINEFRTYSGFTPNEYLQKKSGILNYIPVS